MDTEQNRSKNYNRIKIITGITHAVLMLLTVTFYVYTGFSKTVYSAASGISENGFISFFIFSLLSMAGISLLFLPLNFYSSYMLEHRFGLSNQTLTVWIKENLKGSAVGLLFGVPVLSAFYYILNTYGELWWFPFAVFMFLFSVVLSQIVPVYILPLFYKLTPVEDADLIESVKRMGKEAGLSIVNVFSFDMSKNTRKANAAFTGLGRSKRILLGDNLLNNFTPEEIETVLAHEFGHYKYKHITKNIITGTVFSFLQLFLISLFYSFLSQKAGSGNIMYAPDLPLIITAGMIISALFTPAGNYISRKYEYEADEYAVKATGKPDDFITALKKLTGRNLGDENPHPFVEWYFYSHPSTLKRGEAVKKLLQ